MGKNYMIVLMQVAFRSRGQILLSFDGSKHLFTYVWVLDVYEEHGANLCSKFAFVMDHHINSPYLN